MPTFLYRVARSDGTTLDGQLDSDNESLARAQLEGQGLLVFRLQPKGSWSSVASVSIQTRGRISLQEFLIFNQELLALIRAGLPVLRVFDLLIERARHAGFRRILEGVREDIRGGASASEALSRHPTYFPDLYIASIRAGEQAGNLTEVLQRYIVHLKLMIGLRQKITKALLYPAFLVLIGIVVVAFMLGYVLPVFMEVYQGSAKSLPYATQLLITVVERGQVYLLPAVVSVVVMGITLWSWYRTAPGRALLDRVLLRLPWLGDMLMRHHTIQFTRTLATVLSGGTPLVEALRIARGAVSNRFMAAGLAGVVVQIQEGTTLAASLEQHKVVPRLALEMLAVGEETGSLEIMLRDVAEFYEGEMDFQLGQLTAAIEPVLLLLMGIVVGTIVIVMYLPVFEMAGAV